MNQEIIEKAIEIISSERLDCVLALIDLKGYPVASTITVSKADGINWITFVINNNSTKLKRIIHNNRASVCFTSMPKSITDPLYNITLVGIIEEIIDPNIKREMWYDECKDHFNGPEDPNYCVLKFTTEWYKLFIEFETFEGKI